MKKLSTFNNFSIQENFNEKFNLYEPINMAEYIDKTEKSIWFVMNQN